MPAIRASPAYLKSSRSTSINMGSFTPPLLSLRKLSAAKQKKRDIEKRFCRTALQAMPESTTPRTPNIDQLPSLPLDREPPHFVTGTVLNSMMIQEKEDLEPENTSSESSDESPLREVEIKEMLYKSMSSSSLSLLSFQSLLQQVREGCSTPMKSPTSSLASNNWQQQHENMMMMMKKLSLLRLVLLTKSKDLLKNRGSLIVLRTDNRDTESMENDQDAAILLCYDVPSHRIVYMEAVSQKSISPIFLQIGQWW
jgi:hypothetical protein